MEQEKPREDSNELGLDSLKVELLNQVAVVRFDQVGRKVNTLNSELSPQFDKIFDYLKSSEDVKAMVIISGKKDCFIAGADIEELQQAKTTEEVKNLSQTGQAFFNRLEALDIPVVAAIHGSCLGGGLELALSCSYRIATSDEKTRFGLPEVMLGLLPGAGGTQRLPRLIGLEKALGMMLAGNQINSSKAMKVGLIDHVVSQAALEDIAIRAALQLADGSLRKKQKKRSGVSSYLEKVSQGRDFVLQQALKQVMAKTRGLYPAPKAIIDVVGYGLDHGMEKGLEKEAEEFAKLSQTSHFRGLVSLYFGQTELKKNRFKQSGAKVDDLSILGAGLMGAGIALVSLQKGFHVRLKDISQEGLGKGKKYIWDALQKKVRRKSISRFEADRTMSNLVTQLDHQHFDKTGLVIEAVFEDLDLKHRVLKEVEEHCSENVVFASNTSALPIAKIAEASKRPQNVVGMHYFSPVHKMPLLEVITTEQTSENAAAMAVDVGIRQGKTVIVVKDGPGFYTTRILAPFMDEASLLAAEGVEFNFLDEALMDFGYPVGPMTLIDEVGIDVAYHVSHDLGQAFGSRVSSGDTKVLSALIEKGQLGKKSGKGFYCYKNKKADLLSRLQKSSSSATKEVNPLVLQLIRENSPASPKLIDKSDIQKRMTYRMINEAVYCLEEGILSRPLDGDIGAVFGLGFPPFLGGPFRYIDSLGADVVLKDLEAYHQQFGERFAPAQLLIDHGKSGKKFYPN